jgi:hypothetical protein
MREILATFRFAAVYCGMMDDNMLLSSAENTRRASKRCQPRRRGGMPVSGWTESDADEVRMVGKGQFAQGKPITNF